jgi:AcrR family transcriptional regulator
MDCQVQDSRSILRMLVSMLTRKGVATRARILDAAGELIAQNGAADTSLDDVRVATGTSKSQLFHYFPEGKAQLLLAAAEEQARKVLDDQRPLLDHLDTWEAWHQWQQLILDMYAPKIEYCPLAALTSQFPKNDPQIGALISGLFGQWQERLAHGLGNMQARGLLDPNTDAERLAVAVLAAIQGGVAIGQATKSLTPLEIALQAALDHLHTHETVLA